jgi:hypothetical protein
MYVYLDIDRHVYIGPGSEQKEREGVSIYLTDTDISTCMDDT